MDLAGVVRRADDCCRQQRVHRRAVSNRSSWSPVSRRQRPDRAVDPQPHPGQARLPARHHLQARPCTVPARSAESGYGRRKCSRRDARSGDSRQPSPLRHPGRRRYGQARATGSAGDPRHEGVGAASGGRSRTTPRHARIRRPVAQLPHMGRGVPGEPLPPRRNDTGDRLNVRSGCAGLRLAAPHLNHAVRAGLAVAGCEVTGHGYGGIQVVDQAVPVHRVLLSHAVA